MPHVKHEDRHFYRPSCLHPYVLHADYRAGGKMAPSLPQSNAEKVHIQAADADGSRDPKHFEDMEAAARVLRSVVEGKDKKGGNATDVGSNLSSSFWTDLVD